MCEMSFTVPSCYLGGGGEGERENERLLGENIEIREFSRRKRDMMIRIRGGEHVC